MVKVDRELVQNKLQALQGYYQELKNLEHLTFTEYSGNNLYKRAVERLIQLIVESGTDINNILLKSLKKGPAVDYYSSFIELAELDVIPMDFALNIAPSTGLRNIIVHEYQKINDEVVYKAIGNTLKYYLEYLHLINKYVGR